MASEQSKSIKEEEIILMERLYETFLTPTEGKVSLDEKDTSVITKNGKIEEEQEKSWNLNCPNLSFCYIKRVGTFL